MNNRDDLDKIATDLMKNLVNCLGHLGACIS